jgi:hypothetical protein
MEDEKQDGRVGFQPCTQTGIQSESALFARPLVQRISAKANSAGVTISAEKFPRFRFGRHFLFNRFRKPDKRRERRELMQGRSVVEENTSVT